MATFNEIVDNIEDQIRLNLSTGELNLKIIAYSLMDLGKDLWVYFSMSFKNRSELNAILNLHTVKIRVTEEFIVENHVSSVKDDFIQIHLKWEVK